MRREIASPSPVPSFLVVKNGSKTRSRTSGGIPGPVSARRSSTTRPCGPCAGARVSESVPPSPIAWTALVMTLTMTCSRVRGSASQRGVAGSKAVCTATRACCSLGCQGVFLAQAAGDVLNAGADVVDRVADFVGEDRRDLAEQRPLRQDLGLVLDRLALRHVAQDQQQP